LEFLLKSAEIGTRRTNGDLPDYVCGKDKTDVNLLEAKGRYRSVTFKSREFEDFRAQIDRAQLLGTDGKPMRVKGFISAMRWATEKVGAFGQSSSCKTLGPKANHQVQMAIQTRWDSRWSSDTMLRSSTVFSFLDKQLEFAAVAFRSKAERAAASGDVSQDHCGIAAS
jgi:hypothetical protein